MSYTLDSDSKDESVQLAVNHGAEIVELDATARFTAARARNAGFKRIFELAPDLAYVQFLDGDSEILDGWTEQALSFMESNPDVGVTCGRLHERHPERSIYNWLCDKEWDRPVGEIGACGGIAMMRVRALTQAKGFREDLIAGEESELCVRLRAAGWRIWRLDTDMASHDAAMNRFAQWWARNTRSGYSFAQGAYLHGGSPGRHFVWESIRPWLWGVGVPLMSIFTTLLFGPWGLVPLLSYPLNVLQKVVRGRGPLTDRVLLSSFYVLGHFAESWGQIKFLRDRLFGRQAQLIEYK